MAAAAAARSFLRSSCGASLRGSAARAASRSSAAAPSSAAARLPRGSRSIAPSLIRSPVEMSSFCVESLMPMHSATAAALMTSLLTSAPQRFGWLSEGQDETR